MRYLVTARVKPGERDALARAIDDGTLGEGSIAGDEYVRNMAAARELDDGRVQWVEVCYCATPLAEEREYWEPYFTLEKVQDAHARSRCRDLTGTEPWACGDCDCSARLEARLETKGRPFRPERSGRSAFLRFILRAVASSSLQALLVRAGAALDRGRGAEAAQMLGPALRSSSLTRDEELTVRSMQAEAALLQDDLDQAASSLGRPPDTFRDNVPARRVATLWRLHGRLASARGDQSRAIAMHARALKNAETAHDSRGIGLAHYELGQCYRQVGDIAIVREHISKAASALHAAGDRRHLALVHSLSSISLAQLGRYDEAMSALRQAERFASMVHADDVLATVCGNQANVMMMQHRHEQALALAERSVALHEAHGSGHGLAVALATLGQICVRLGDLVRAEDALHRALEVRSPIQFHETTGAVFDTLAQIHLIRGRYDTASDFLGRASEAYGAYGRQTSKWYEWSVRVLGARLALRRAALDDAVARVDEILQAGAPPFDALQATLIAAEALILGNQLPQAEAAAGGRRRGRRPENRAGGLGRIPPASRSAPREEPRRRRGLPRLLSERSVARSARRALSIGTQSSGARAAGRRDRRPVGRRTPPEQGARHLRAARRRARPRRHARRAVAPDHDRHRPIRHFPCRCRRCRRAAHRGCGGAAGAARTRDRLRAARGRGRRLRGRLRGARRRRRPRRRLRRLRAGRGT